VCNTHKVSMILHESLECYNVVKEVPETEGEGIVQGAYLEPVAYTQPINMWKVNIGMTKNLMFA